MGNSESTQCFSCTTHANSEQPRPEWRSFLKGECSELSDRCQWAKAISKQLKNLKKAPGHVYFQQLQNAHAEYRVLQVRSSKSFSYSSQNLCSISIMPPSEQQSVRRLLKQTDLIEATIQTRQHQLNPYTSGGTYNSSYVFLEKLDQLKMMAMELENTELLTQQLHYYIKISAVIKQQLSKTDHQLNFVLNVFTAAFIKTYNTGRSGADLNNCIFDVQQFSRIFQEAIELYYCYEQLSRSVGKVSDLLNRENMLAQIVGVIFERELIYEIIYDCAVDALRAEVEQLRQAMLRLKDVDCIFFEIDKKFRLDATTHDYIMQTQPQARNGAKLHAPYEASIKLMQELGSHFSPQSKFKAIIKCQQRIMKSIKLFYEDRGCQCEHQLDSDNLLSIQMYIVCKSQLFELPVHIYLIEQLATNKMIHGAPGYYLISLQAAIKMILQLKN